MLRCAARRGDGLPNAQNGRAKATARVDFCGSPCVAGRFRGGKQALRAAWPPGDGENHRLTGGEKGFYSSYSSELTWTREVDNEGIFISISYRSEIFVYLL